MARLLRSTTLIVVTALGLVAAGCGGNDKSSSPTTAAEAAKPRSGGSLTYGLEAESAGGWCLAEAQLAAAGIQVANAVYDPLMAYDADFVAKPYLAESVDHDATFSTWTFKLRSGVTFHDGSPLTAQVVKDNIDLWRGDADAVAKFKRQPLLFPFLFKNIAAVTAPDDLTVVVTTATPWPAFPDYLASGRNGIMGTAQYSDPNCAEKLVGTGPFKLVSWKRNQSLELARNPSYWRKDASGTQLPYLDKLTFKPIPPASERFDALDGGTVDAAHINTQTVIDEIEKDTSKFVSEPEVAGHGEVSYGLLNSGRAPLSDPEVRKHLVMAIDRDKLNEINTGGVAKLADGPFDTKVMGYLKDPGRPKYDPDTANTFFKGKNVSISLSYDDTGDDKPVATEIMRELNSVGVQVRLDQKDQTTLIDQALGGDFDLLLWRNHPGGDPDTQYVWWHSGSPANFGKIADPKIDADLESGRAEIDPAKRRAIYEDLNRAFAAGNYNLWNWYSHWIAAGTTKVHGLADTTLPDGSKGAGINWGWHFLTEAWVDK